MMTSRSEDKAIKEIKQRIKEVAWEMEYAQEKAQDLERIKYLIGIKAGLEQALYIILKI